MKHASGPTPKPVKRFYDEVGVKQQPEGFVITLDGRTAKTPEGGVLTAPTRELADAAAEEWRAAGEMVLVDKMPITRFLFAVADSSKEDRVRWADDIISFLGSDLLCYRADAPGALRQRQAAVWDPYLDWARCVMGLRLNTTTDLIAVVQPQETLESVRATLGAEAPEIVLGLKIATELTGSAVLALALWKRAFPPDEIFAAARVDEKFQAGRWGVDAEAQAREQQMRAEFMSAARFLGLLEG